jgi:hypothetical protein
VHSGVLLGVRCVSEKGPFQLSGWPLFFLSEPCWETDVVWCVVCAERVRPAIRRVVCCVLRTAVLLLGGWAAEISIDPTTKLGH